MRSTTNLAWPTEPFGAGQRPFGKAQPMLAAIGAGWEDSEPRPRWGCAVYLAVASTRTLCLDGHQLNVGFEVLTPDPGDEPGAFAGRMDERLVACRRRAKFLAGHNLAPDLERLAQVATAQRLPGAEGVRQQWINRADKGRGMATMIDTSHDIDPAGPVSLGTACEHSNLVMTTGSVGPEPAATVRSALARTLAVALIAARATGRYGWSSPVDIGQLVTHVAWDLLAELGENPRGDVAGATIAVSCSDPRR